MTSNEENRIPLYTTVILFSSLLLVLSMACRIDSSESQISNPSFTKVVIHDEFISEGVAIGDVNGDGLTDVMSGFYWFEAPDWISHEIANVDTFDYTKGYSRSFLNFPLDVNFDGKVDLIKFDFPGEGVYWYENTGQNEGHWPVHLIDSTACNESPMMADVDNDGRMDLVFGRESTGEMIWSKSPSSAENQEWISRAISEPNAPGTGRFSHGLGFGDVNGDGRNDIIVREGWWEAPVDRTDIPWLFHPAPLGLACSQMYTGDFDEDGDQDIVSSSAHAFGIWWYEQIQSDGQIDFIRHLIDSSFSQTHGMAYVDMNLDNVPDLVTGKRFFAHQGKDPGGLEDPVLYWFESGLNENGSPKWTPHLIDDDSGAGLQVVVEDLDGDGKLDIINANKKGVIVFVQN